MVRNNGVLENPQKPLGYRHEPTLVFEEDVGWEGVGKGVGVGGGVHSLYIFISTKLKLTIFLRFHMYCKSTEKTMPLHFCISNRKLETSVLLYFSLVIVCCWLAVGVATQSSPFSAGESQISGN